MKLAALFAALALVLGCEGASAPDEESTVAPTVKTSAQVLDRDPWGCYQICADGSSSMGFGGTADLAYQDMPGCGPGGGTINCQQGILQ